MIALSELSADRLASSRNAMKFTRFFLGRATSMVVVGRRSPYFNVEERLKHRLYIRHLAEEVHRPVHEIMPLYEDVLSHYKAHAKVHDYLPILVSKNVKSCFKSGVGRAFSNPPVR